MPHGGIVDLTGIRIVRVQDQLRVVLLFVDSTHQPHTATYSPEQFLAALDQIASSRRAQRLVGLAALGVYAEEQNGIYLYCLKLDSGFIGSLGGLLRGACNALMLLLHEDSPRPDQLRRALRARQELDMESPYYHP